MFSHRSFYPWYSVHSAQHQPATQPMDSLAVFLKSACLTQYHELFRKLRIKHPTQFGQYRSCDLLRLGLSEAEINRLVGRLLDLELPVGHLLDADGTQLNSFCSEIDLRPIDLRDRRLHTRSKLFRKLFKRRDVRSSAPASPAHGYQLFDTSQPDSRRVSTSHLNRSDPVRPHSFVLPNDTYLPLPYVQHLADQSTSAQSKTYSHPPLTCLVPEEDIKLHARIGVGSFGIVHRADWTTPSGEVIPVAVKLLRPQAMAGDHFMGFLDELRAMQCLSHPNLIRLYGVCLSNPIMMVTELAPLGSLLLHLRAQSLRSLWESSPTSANSTAQLPLVPIALQVDALWDMGVQIAQGMVYLSSRGLVHRDLAARNILLASVRKNEYPMIKIGDFGLVRAVSNLSTEDVQHSEDNSALDEADVSEGDKQKVIYRGRIEQQIPLAWSAPESIRNRIFSQASDVWSWAVTCWEMWTSGAVPWPSMDSVRLLCTLDSGRRLVWPRATCPRRLYQLMLACWRIDPEQRPSFTYLANRLNQIRPFEVVATQTFDEADHLGLESGDVVVVIDSKPDRFWWRGQNRRTGEVGSFPRGIVRRENSPSETNRSLSSPCVSESIKKSRTSVANPRESSFAVHPDDTRMVSKLKTDAVTPDRAPYGHAQSEELWYPLRDFLGNDSCVNGSIATRSEDSFSIITTDRSSELGSGPSLDRYDDGDDERFVLDHAPGSKIDVTAATKSKLTRSQTASVCASNDRDLYTCTTSLPPPPGPSGCCTIEDDGAKANTTSCTRESFRCSNPPSGVVSSSAQSHLSSHSASSRVPVTLQNDSTPPLIDLHSTISHAPVSYSAYSFPAPSAPIYQPHLACFHPTYNYGIRMSYAAIPQWNNMAPFPTRNQNLQSHPFSPPASTTDSRWSSPPSGPNDPFDWDKLIRSMPEPRNADGDGSRIPTPTPDWHQAPPSDRVHVEKELLVGSASSPRSPSTRPVDRAQSAISGFSSSYSTSANVSKFTPCAGEPEAVSRRLTSDVINVDSSRSTCDRLLYEIECIRSQLPGCSNDEARDALSYLLNPFASLPPHLIVPPPQSNQFYPNAKSQHIPSSYESASRIQLAIRVILTNRLFRLGVADWVTCCRALSLTHWNLSLAANRLLNRDGFTTKAPFCF